ncbi:ATP-dependent zinc metalloprotease FtsH [Candidatus Solincola tengchongensis]|uniref:ATP-dependent zinc metalloprotease FtsH n=1 Tax=Candidatus Solincola tengchongensis TaxID=2900693 RepID=UPI00257A0EC6|nr:ATP-dependent zinc metalloprotease FtsH [Candidatus Solincola tengchongensis]
MDESRKKKLWLYVVYGLLALGIILSIQFAKPFQPSEISYSEFLNRLNAGEVSKVVITDTRIEGTMQTEEGEKNFVATRIPDTDIKDLVALLEERGVDFSGRVENTFWRDFLLTWVLPLGLIAFIWFFVFRRLARRVGGVSPMSFGQSKVKLYDRSVDRVTFGDVAGLDEAKEELQEIIDFLRHPLKYRNIGARIPKGVLLVGPPGTGKTLLARAVAGEADVPFFSISGSQFMEMFVGVGAARVRDLFEQAKAKAPCIVFIDEIDTIGKVRGGIMASGGTEEREQTLNQLLSEMDGFDPQTGVIILAATNRPEVLDPAILRPGRFDRQIMIDRPDIKGREEILKVHARRVKLGSDVDLKKIAARTPGFAGAELANVVNEAALLAARKNKKAVDQQEFEEAIDRVIGGLELKSRVMSERERRVVAFHEVGHALAASLLEHADPVHRITVIPRGIGSLGMTMQLPEEDRYIMTRPELEDRLGVLLAGRAAEEIVFGQVSTGAQNDLEKATILARKMVEDYGMSEKLGPVSLGLERGARLLLGEFSYGKEANYSEATAELIDREVKDIVTSNYERVKGLLASNRKALEGIAEILLEKETLEGDAFRELLMKLRERPEEEEKVDSAVSEVAENR